MTLRSIIVDQALTLIVQTIACVWLASYVWLPGVGWHLRDPIRVECYNGRVLFWRSLPGQTIWKVEPEERLHLFCQSSGRGRLFEVLDRGGTLNARYFVMALWVPMFAFMPLSIFRQLVPPYRRKQRLARGCCVTCGYLLHGLPDGHRCPECGQEPRSAQFWKSQWRRRLVTNGLVAIAWFAVCLCTWFWIRSGFPPEWIS